MQSLERKLDAVIHLVMAETEAERSAAKAELDNILTAVEKAETDPESMIRAVLLELGVPDHIFGHKYLVTAILLTVKDQISVNHIMRRLYPAVANEHGTTPSKVERAIRHAVEIAFDRGDADTLYQYFGNTINGCKGKATNSEFIARIANDIRARVVSHG